MLNALAPKSDALFPGVSRPKSKGLLVAMSLGDVCSKLDGFVRRAAGLRQAAIFVLYGCLWAGSSNKARHPYLQRWSVHTGSTLVGLPRSFKAIGENAAVPLGHGTRQLEVLEGAPFQR